MGAIFSSRKLSKEELEIALNKAKQIINSHPVVVFSKTYCPYCTRVKQLFAQLGAKFHIVELNEQSDGSDIQAALAEWTGQRTVPNVFIQGNHIGGCDSVMAKNQEGTLMKLLKEAGAIGTDPVR
ncbi:hypothetical protein ACFE04_028360 [Oxalis oulophora]